MSKKCSECGVYKALDEFHKNSRGTFGRQSMCKTCRLHISAEWRKANPDYSSQRAEAGYWKDYRWARLFKRYGISRVEYEDLLSSQGGVCAICGGNNGGKWLDVDHDHTAGRVRGLLCGPCNKSVGIIERAGWMEAAGAYLSRYRVSNTGSSETPVLS